LIDKIKTKRKMVKKKLEKGQQNPGYISLDFSGSEGFKMLLSVLFLNRYYNNIVPATDQNNKIFRLKYIRIKHNIIVKIPTHQQNTIKAIEL